MSLFGGTKARIKLGQHFMSTTMSLTAEGYVLYKEWDPVDKKNYYWEEWELRGFNTIDSWIEYDHYTDQITRYVPIRTAQKIDLTQLVQGQTVEIETKDGPVAMYVHEVGAGTVVRREGTLSYHVFKDDVVKYAELHGANNLTQRFSVEVYNDKEFDIYEGQQLSPAAQKQLLGKVVGPRKGLWATILTIAFVGFILVMSIFPHKETTCTPRTASSSDPTSSTTASTTTSQNCTTRTVYGFGSGGTGGAGK